MKKDRWQSNRARCYVHSMVALIASTMMCALGVSPAFAASQSTITIPIDVDSQSANLTIPTLPISFFTNGELEVSGSVLVNGLTIPIQGVELGINPLTNAENVYQILGVLFVSNVVLTAQASTVPVGSADPFIATAYDATGNAIALPSGATVTYDVSAPSGVSSLQYNIANQSGFTAQEPGVYTITPMVSQFGTQVTGTPLQITVTYQDNIVFQMSSSTPLTQLYVSYSNGSSTTSGTDGVTLQATSGFTQSNQTVTLTPSGMQQLNAILAPGQTYGLSSEGMSDSGLILMADPTQTVSYTAPGSTGSSSSTDSSTTSPNWTAAGNPLTGTSAPVSTYVNVNGVLYSGTKGDGVWMESGSGSSGTTWTQAGTNATLNAATITALVNADGTLYAGTSDDGVWLFSGSTWTQVGTDSTLNSGDVTSLTYANGELDAVVGGVVWQYPIHIQTTALTN
ncbi:PQQ-like beta-propeller repeat protein [Sulfoacidibacillus ferrooxidans]|uniref:Uncharacterized protein n=1 Tax=Sulfoacidibacillus ferrooxidans TaxID=2005001 RepID=A0A9X1VCC6_9BACL|nr:PQQ-like beta-propeller repeat protein [Sulfoacidibacillus ferrooxidans]MCI0183442.1 hypothetical protein [Sulfoacidibacillus ferrooxidans]